jgi:hypothetical protein
VDPVPDPLILRNSPRAGIEPRISRFLARNELLDNRETSNNHTRSRVQSPIHPASYTLYNRSSKKWLNCESDLIHSAYAINHMGEWRYSPTILDLGT